MKKKIYKKNLKTFWLFFFNENVDI